MTLGSFCESLPVRFVRLGDICRWLRWLRWWLWRGVWRCGCDAIVNARTSSSLRLVAAVAQVLWAAGEQEALASSKPASGLPSQPQAANEPASWDVWRTAPNPPPRGRQWGPTVAVWCVRCHVLPGAT